MVSQSKSHNNNKNSCFKGKLYITLSRVEFTCSITILTIDWGKVSDNVNKAGDCTRWIAPCLFLLFHKACWEVKRLAIYGCDVRLFPRLSRLNKELWRVKRSTSYFVGYIFSYLIYKRHTMIQRPLLFNSCLCYWLMQFFALCTECSHLLCGVAV
jgi:hypothetical protein